MREKWSKSVDFAWDFCGACAFGRKAVKSDWFKVKGEKNLLTGLKKGIEASRQKFDHGDCGD